MELASTQWQGAPNEKKMQATYIWQIAIKWGRWIPFLFFVFLYFLLGCFCANSARGVQKHHTKNRKIHVDAKNLLQKV
jgi:hypothetical protein